MTPPVLLAVLAHPDDESLGVGGTLAKYASEGVDVFLLTATRGDSGRYRGYRADDPQHPGPSALANIRETELRAAASVLGVREVTLLGYRDQHLDRARLDHPARLSIICKLAGGKLKRNRLALARFQCRGVGCRPVRILLGPLPAQAGKGLLFSFWIRNLLHPGYGCGEVG